MNDIQSGISKRAFYILLSGYIIFFIALLAGAFFVYKITLETKATTASVEKMNNSIIRKDEIDPFLSGVVLIRCENSYGSGVLWNDDGVFGVLTNKHVVEGAGCRVSVDDESLEGGGLIYKININESPWNTNSDSAFLQLLPNQNDPEDSAGLYEKLSERKNLPVSDLNYSLSSMKLCDRAEIGMPVVIIGYPSATTQYGKYGSYEPSRTLTDGIISSLSPTEDSIIKDFYVTAKTDAGNSGGAALSKQNGELCLLGVPSWVNIGTYDIQGIVQNIYYILQNKIKENLPNLPKLPNLD